MIHVLMDTEYCYACATREGMLPNYKSILDMFRRIYGEEVTFYAYFVGSKEKKKGVSEFLNKQGVDYRIILDADDISKTQVVAAQMAFDVYRILQQSPDCEFAFVTGDDYMVPISEFITKHNTTPHIYYFPIILQHALKMSRNCKIFQIPNSYMLYPKRKQGESN